MILAAERNPDDIYNVRTSQQYDFRTVVEMINDTLGTAIEPTFVENLIPDRVYVHDTMADSSKIRFAIGWEPSVQFADGIEKVCRPYR